MNDLRLIKLRQRLNTSMLNFESEAANADLLGPAEKEKILEELSKKYDQEIKTITSEAMRLAIESGSNNESGS